MIHNYEVYITVANERIHTDSSSRLLSVLFIWLDSSIASIYIYTWKKKHFVIAMCAIRHYSFHEFQKWNCHRNYNNFCVIAFVHVFTTQINMTNRLVLCDKNNKKYWIIIHIVRIFVFFFVHVIDFMLSCWFDPNPHATLIMQWFEKILARDRSRREENIKNLTYAGSTFPHRYLMFFVSFLIFLKN